ncbi:MAG: coiled-coil domain-containing protein 22 [gamma proteobacterium symbiont of Lucinoma myriamae]|nr:coiled-coil domain-containing protein 22 [gamma proteobacterium symbiont of Lucinoma myriamae]
MNFFIKKSPLVFLIFFITVFLQGCVEQKPNTPLAVAQSFWTAALEGDTETAKQLLTPESLPNFKIILKNPKDFIELGEQSISATQAQILTQLTRHKGNQTEITSLRTILINQNGQWLVDFDKTRDSMLGSELQSVIEQLSNTMRETIDKGVKVMGESVKDELQQMERSLQEGLEEMNKELEKQNKNKQPAETTTL